MYPFPNQSLSTVFFPTAATEPLPGIPVIGVTSQIIRTSKWYKAITPLGFEAVEINRRNSKLYMSTFYLEKIKRYLQGLRISLHSATTGIFQALESFSSAELAVLRAEVDIARILDAGELIFHINANRLDHSNGERLRPVIDYALHCGVLPVYESDAGLNAKQVLRVLDMFPDVGYALDLGHLNNGWGRNLLGCTVEAFVKKVNHRVVYIHANNNDGIKDQHYGLDQGCLDWRSVLDLFDLRQIRKIIIEVCAEEFLDSSRRELIRYLQKRPAVKIGHGKTKGAPPIFF